MGHEHIKTKQNNIHSFTHRISLSPVVRPLRCVALVALRRRRRSRRRVVFYSFFIGNKKDTRCWRWHAGCFGIMLYSRVIVMIGFVIRVLQLYLKVINTKLNKTKLND